MSNPWTQAWAEAQATPSGDTVELVTVELIHPSIRDANGAQMTIRAVNDAIDHTLLLEDSALANPSQNVVFTAIPFQVPWPETEDASTPQMRMRIDGVGRELIPHLSAAVRVSAPLQVLFRIYLWSGNDATAVQAMDPMSVVMRQVTVNESFVEGVASPADLANLQFGRLVFDVKNYPTLTL